MARIETRTQRAKLSAGKRHWHMLETGLAVGYRRPTRGGAGSWYVRALIGEQHKVAALGTADDQAGSGMDWKQAQAAARMWAAKQMNTSGPLTVEAAILKYTDNLRANKGARAADEALGRMRKHLLPVLGNQQVADLATADLTAWRNGLVDLEGDDDEIRRSRDTANRLLGILKAALNHAFNNKMVDGLDDRTWRVVKPFKNVGEARKVILSEQEIQHLLDQAEPGLRELVALGAFTGARLGELTGARRRDFDQAAATLTVKGKTGSRPIPLAPDALALCARLAAGKRPQDHLLRTAGGGSWTPSLHSRPFAAAVAKAGLDPETVFYSLRHSYISQALKVVPPKAVADHCGTSIAMLQRFYAKSFTGDLARYAAMAAPTLKIGETAAKVVPLRAG